MDTWGVDFALLDQKGDLLGNPFHYRDSRTDGMLAEAFRRMPRERIFENTGIQFMEVNTLYQLLAMVVNKSPLLEIAQTLADDPDLFNYWLTGKITCEFTIATTTQCFDPHKRDWARPLLGAMGIPEHLFQPVIEPGTVIDNLAAGVANEVGAGRIPVVAPACHDTGSAVVAIPAEGNNFAWLSSGTWSILGVEADQPVVNDQTLKYNFTNEGGVFGKWRLSKNVMGLWILQECRRTWARQGEELSYDEITRMAGDAKPFQFIIDPDFGGFLHPEDMPDQIRQYCRNTGQPVPQDKGELIRSVLESIALKYRWVLERLEEITGYRFERLHIIGGGTENQPVESIQRGCHAAHLSHRAGGSDRPRQRLDARDCAGADRVVGTCPAIWYVNLFRLRFTSPGHPKEWDQAYIRLLEVIR